MDGSGNDRSLEVGILRGMLVGFFLGVCVATILWVTVGKYVFSVQRDACIETASAAMAEAYQHCSAEGTKFY